MGAPRQRWTSVGRGLRGIGLVIATSVHEAPWQSLAWLVLQTGQVLRVLQPLFLAWFVSGAIQRDIARMALAAAAYLASIVVAKLMSMLANHAMFGQMDRVGFAFDRSVAEVSSRIPTLDHLETPRYLDELQVLRDREGTLGSAFNVLCNTLTSLFVLIGTLTLASAADWRLLLVAAASVPIVLSGRRANMWGREAENGSAEQGRLAGSLLDLGISPAAGAELRVFGLAPTLRGLLRRAVAAWRGPMVTAARKATILDTLTNALFFGVAVAVLAWMVGGVIGGSVSVASLTLALLLVGRLKNAGQTLSAAVISLGTVTRTTSRYFFLLDYEHEVDEAHPGRAEPPAKLHSGLRLDRLTYSYPGSETPALRDVSLDLPAGSVVALVGENGAGKSTLVKLLAGLYRPAGGRILVDGVDLASFDLVGWRARLSGAFQDHARLELLAQETVGVGDLARIEDEGAVRGALRDGAAEDVLASLPSGLATQLGPQWPEGVDLSGGQWQRLALARGMMRQEPLLLVLDEPTAALDPVSEHALFERYGSAARSAKGRGSVTVLVTHRFSTVASADLVVVLHHGEVEEIGTHGELMARGGRYAELYELQATGYRSSLGDT